MRWGTDSPPDLDGAPYEMFWKWISGAGEENPVMNFGPGDPFTQQVEVDPHNQQIMNQLRSSTTLKGQVSKTFQVNYTDTGLGSLLRDGLSAASGGLLSNRFPVDAFLGSYNESYTVESYDPATNSARVHFKVDNTSGWTSFLHYAGEHNANTSHGPGSSITEHLDWTVTINLPTN